MNCQSSKDLLKKKHSLAMRMKNIPIQLLAGISQNRFTTEKLLTWEMTTI
jgi:hypothetical protein